MTFAQTIRQLRQARHLTQRLAAERCGVTTVTFWNWEKGRSTPWQKDQAKHLAALGGETVQKPGTPAPSRRRIIDNLGSLDP